MRSPVRLKLAEAIRAGLDEMAECWVGFVRANEIGANGGEPFEEALKRARIGLEVLANLLEGADYTKYENVIRRLLHDWINQAGSFSDLLTIERVFPLFALSHLEIDPESAEADSFLNSMREFFQSDARARFLSDYLLVFEEIVGAESSHTAYVLAHFDALLALTAHLNGAGTREEIIEGLAPAMQDLLDNVIAVAVLAETSDGLKMEAGTFQDENASEEADDEEIAKKLEEIYTLGEVTHIAGIDMPQAFRSLADCGIPGEVVGCVIPIRPREADGLLVVMAMSGDAAGTLEFPLARIAASECALALDRAEGRTRVSRMNSRVRDILSLSRESGWGTGYREAAELVLDYLLDLTGGRSALILAASPIGLTSGAIRPLAWREVSADDIAPYEAGALPAIVSLTAKSGRPLLLPTEELESVLGRRKPPSGFCPSTNEALGTLPLIRRNSLLGVCLFLCPQRFAFEPESKSILEIFAGTAADCLATAQEYERSLRATRIEEAEAQRARALQQELTPSFLRSGNLVLWAHLHAAGELAGDIVMARSSSPGRMAVWAADVAGRGVSAAWSMMLLRQLLAELSPETTGPANALSMINSRLHRVESLEPSTGLFATLIGLLLDEEKQVARCARAGAPRLFHVDSQGAIKGWAPDGLALGLAPDADFEEIEIPLKPGDKLVWASDGLINAKDGAGRRWGEGGLTDSILAAASLPARALYERILSAVGEFGAVEEAQDDRSLIVIGHDIGPDWTGQASGAERGRLLEDALGFLSGGVDVGTRDFTALRLLLDEAIKNAHEHGNKLNDHAFIEVRIILSRSHVHLRVRDEGGKLNEQATGVALRNESLLEDKGRGFLLMRHHADHLWVEDDHGELNAVRLLEGPA